MYLCCVRSSASGYLYGESYSEDKVLEKIKKFEKIEKIEENTRNSYSKDCFRGLGVPAGSLATIDNLHDSESFSSLRNNNATLAI